MSNRLTEDCQVQQTTADCLRNAHGWKSHYSYNQPYRFDLAYWQEGGTVVLAK
ncbi:MAG: hypothetical protein KAV87_56385 [Desulfobacteraceae bacterium]|nr:hypothetical protein [Desulfobacteraceae bacterium]